MFGAQTIKYFTKLAEYCEETSQFNAHKNYTREIV